MTASRSWLTLLAVFVGLFFAVAVIRIVIFEKSAKEVCDVCGKPATRHEKGPGGMPCHYCDEHVSGHFF